MLPDCDVCGEPRVNGTAIEKTASGWRLNDGAGDYEQDHVQFACQECVADRLDAT